MSASASHLESWMQGKHVWLADHFSVPAETLCMLRAPSPDADHFCHRVVNHPGNHEFHFGSDLRVKSWKDSAA